MSEVMLQKSISASSLVKQAAAAVQAQQTAGVTLEGRKRRPFIGRATSDFTLQPTRTISRDTTDYFSSQSTSGLQTPDLGERRHIRFDEKVEQCIAVEVKGADEDDEEDFNHNPWAKYRGDDDSSSDEGVVMMKRSRRKRPLSRTSSKTSISGENKTIAKLPSTTLKYRIDSPDITDQQPTHSLGFFRPSRLSPSPSQETLRPSNPSTNFLLSDEDEDDENDFTFNPSRAYEVKRVSTPTPSDPHSQRPSTPPDQIIESGGLRRTASGMFMPFEDEDDNASPSGLIGKVVDTVNTARDIAHVIWNVGWRSGN